MTKSKYLALIMGILLVGCSAPAATATLLAVETEAVPTPTQSAETGRYVVIDSDMGEDSVMEILYLLQAEGVDVKAITVAGDGEAHCQPGMRTALGLLALIPGRFVLMRLVTRAGRGEVLILLTRTRKILLE